MGQSGRDRRTVDLFTKGNRHKNLSVIYIVQNIFHQGLETRDISLNTLYIVLIKSPRDKQQISTLVYLMLDLKPTNYDDHRLRTNVLPRERDGLQQQLRKYIKMQSYRQPPIYNAIYSTKQQMEDIINKASMTPDEKNALYSNQYHRLQAFQNQLQNQIQDSINQLTVFLSKVTKSANKASNKRRNLPRYCHAYDADTKKVIQIRVINHVNNSTGAQMTLMPRTTVQTLQHNQKKAKWRIQMKQRKKILTEMNERKKTKGPPHQFLII